MIRLKRIRSEDVVHNNFYGERKETFERELLFNERRIKRGEKESHEFRSDRWNPAKEQLLAETRGKCAYCEAPISVVAYGDVEHYRPKSIYWWLAYCYDNYLAACQICNQRFKKDLLPIQNQRMRGPTITLNTTDGSITVQAGTIAPDPLNQAEVDDFIYLHQQERPLLLNPYFDDPSDYFAWRADDVLREVEITIDSEEPQVEIVVQFESSDVESIAAASIETYGLNRKELKGRRYEVYKLYSTYRMTLEDERIGLETRQLTKEMIERMKAPEASFSGMIRYFDDTYPDVMDKLKLIN